MLVVNATFYANISILFCSYFSDTEENQTFLSSVTSSLLIVHGPTAKSRLKLKTVKSRIITVIRSYRFSIVIRDWARAMVLNRVSSVPWAHLAMSGGIFDCHELEEGHCQMPYSVADGPYNKNFPAPNVNIAKVKQP